MMFQQPSQNIQFPCDDPEEGVFPFNPKYMQVAVAAVLPAP
jgi:hypothetical protein